MQQACVQLAQQCMGQGMRSTGLGSRAAGVERQPGVWEQQAGTATGKLGAGFLRLLWRGAAWCSLALVGLCVSTAAPARSLAWTSSPAAVSPGAAWLHNRPACKKWDAAWGVQHLSSSAAGTTLLEWQQQRLPQRRHPELHPTACHACLACSPLPLLRTTATESITKTKQAVELLKKVGAYADVEKAKVSARLINLRLFALACGCFGGRGRWWSFCGCSQSWSSCRWLPPPQGALMRGAACTVPAARSLPDATASCNNMPIALNSCTPLLCCHRPPRTCAAARVRCATGGTCSARAPWWCTATTPASGARGLGLLGFLPVGAEGWKCLIVSAARVPCSTSPLLCPQLLLPQQGLPQPARCGGCLSGPPEPAAGALGCFVQLEQPVLGLQRHWQMPVPQELANSAGGWSGVASGTVASQ